MGRKRNDGGQFAPSIEDDDVLRALRAHPEPVATTSDLADALGVTTETVRRHLSALRDAEQVGRKEVGARAVVWWPIPDDPESDAPAAPLRRLVGLLDEDEADAARERSREWGEAFDETMAPDTGKR